MNRLLLTIPSTVQADLAPLIEQAMAPSNASSAWAMLTASPSASSPWWNPLNFSLVTFVVLTIVKAVAEELLSFAIVTALQWSKHTKLPSRVPVPMMKGLETLQAKDYAFLVINQFVEMSFVVHLFALMLRLPKFLAEATLMNTVVAFYMCFIIDDFFYYWAHRFMHLPAVYPWCHKHHHRQALPARGYLDAANEHPMEQVVGLGCVYLALFAVIATTGFHAGAVFFFFVAYASLAMLNHTPYDVQLGWLMLGYAVRAHEMHQ